MAMTDAQVEEIRNNDEIRVSAGEYELDWSDTPKQFRHILTPLRLVKLIRVADSVTMFNPAMQGNSFFMQKMRLIETVKLMQKDTRIACEFDGLALEILGVVEYEDQKA